MNLKTFAQQSRNLLMDGVAQKLLYWGFNEDGTVLEELQKISGGYLLRGEPYDDPHVPKLWNALKQAIQKKGIEVVVEEAAYTWFNRMMAIKILSRNGYDEYQLEYVEGMEHTPIMLQRARQGSFDFLTEDEKNRLKRTLKDYTKDQEAFAILLTGYCHYHHTLKRIFGRIDDYTELLLPDNMLQDGGFLHLLNITDAITEEDYRSVELIGWLYQFYISEKKDEVFASFKKSKKAEAKDIPAATQIFTPNWIVKYMVENTAGKTWLDLNPDSPLKNQMDYLVESESNGEVKPIISSVVELTLMDPASGSGHILVEAFDLLYQMYMEEYYSPEEALESILKNNLYGLDLDERATQLATFAVLLKAAKVHPDVWNKDWFPNIFPMPEPVSFNRQELKDFLGDEGEDFLEDMEDALHLMKQAKNLGSVMKFDLSSKARSFIEFRFEGLKANSFREFNEEAIYQKIEPYIDVLLLLTKKYTSVVANPPYMGQKSMNGELKDYLNTHYPATKSDLMTIFMEVIPNLTRDESRFALINLPSWLFLSSFKKIRENYINKYTFDSLLHMGRGIFGIDFGSVALTLEKKRTSNAIGSYFRLHDRNFQHIYYDDIKKLFLYSNNNESYKYDFTQYRGDEGITEIPKQGTSKGLKLYYPNIPQINFSKLPGSPIAYWVSEITIKHFEKEKKISDYLDSGGRIKTHGNEKFLRLCWEVNKNQIGFDVKWKFVENGGNKRKWYGNRDTIVDWSKEAVNFYDTHGGLSNPKYWKKKGLSWAIISSKGSSFRYKDENAEYTSASPTLIPREEGIIEYALGFLNTKYVFDLLKVLNPTINTTSGDVQSLPFIYKKEIKPKVILIVEKQIDISKKDWDSRETSWDFEKSPLINESPSLNQAYQTWKEQVTQDFFQLHANEEKLNRIFIDLYTIQDELTSDVSLKNITILQEELDRKELEQLEPTFREQGKEAIDLPIDKSEVISQFISYAVGVFIGRYRLDQTRLNIAHPDPTSDELAPYTYNGHTIEIDKDAIIPLMGSGSNFSDDAVNRFNQLLDVIWGHHTRTENINFIQDSLNEDIEKYLVKNFYKIHCSMYQKKPIYWLFSSKRGAFQVLVYMHRMNEFTAEKIRANYLLEHIKYLRNVEAMLAKDESSLGSKEARQLEQIRNDIHECEEYDMKLKDIADQQIKFDLDDGVSENYKLFKEVLAEIK